MSASPHVHLIDDEPTIRSAAPRLLRTAGITCSDYPDIETFLSNPIGSVVAPACILLDIGLPGRNGLEAQTSLAGLYPTLPIVFLTGRDDASSSIRALKSGAFDYLLKPIDSALLIPSVRAALRRSSELASRRQIADQDAALLAKLTPREREVLILVTKGLLNKQVAERLGTAEKTVKVQRASVMIKLNADSVADLVRFVDRLELDGKK
jgi:FixJ family two-component response regulator